MTELGRNSPRLRHLDLVFQEVTVDSAPMNRPWGHARRLGNAMPPDCDLWIRAGSRHELGTVANRTPYSLNRRRAVLDSQSRSGEPASLAETIGDDLMTRHPT